MEIRKLFVFFATILQKQENYIPTEPEAREEKFDFLEDLVEEVMDEENEEIAKLKTHFNSIEDVEADLESVGREKSTVAHEQEKTMSEYNIDEAKKVYFYSDILMEKINNNESLDEEDYIWQVPIVNALGDNGVAYFEEIDESGYLEPSALEFPIDNRELYLNNDKILQIINDYTDDNISGIYFANIPVTVNGVVCAIVKLDTDESLFIPIQDVQYYNDMELGEVYTYDEMMDYIDM